MFETEFIPAYQTKNRKSSLLNKELWITRHLIWKKKCDHALLNTCMSYIFIKDLLREDFFIMMFKLKLFTVLNVSYSSFCLKNRIIYSATFWVKPWHDLVHISIWIVWILHLVCKMISNLFFFSIILLEKHSYRIVHNINGKRNLKYSSSVCDYTSMTLSGIITQ